MVRVLNADAAAAVARQLRMDYVGVGKADDWWW